MDGRVIRDGQRIGNSLGDRGDGAVENLQMPVLASSTDLCQTPLSVTERVSDTPTAKLCPAVFGSAKARLSVTVPLNGRP